MSGAKKFATPINRNLRRIKNGLVKVVVGDNFQYGFFISPTYIVTNKFFIDKQMDVDVELANGGEILGTIIRKHSDIDIAMIEVEETGYLSLPVCYSDVSMEKDVYTVGKEKAQFGKALKTRGFLTAAKASVISSGSDGIVKVKINGGNARSPLFDESGNIVAIPDIKSIGYDTAQYVIIKGLWGR
ncbi:MAG: trypsin-like peptidase domain-containing protein [Alphaproteobacteria bacterium]|nr:trypsin-like peptidase domain-containing protein [Alphaproteobacteria bacterium]